MADHADWPYGSLLGNLPVRSRTALLDAGQPALFRAERPLMLQGEAGNCAHLLLAGCVRVVATTASGQEAFLAVRIRGSLLGEMACLNDQPRTASVVAVGDVETRRVGRAALLAVMREHPEVALEINRMLSARLRWANERRIDLVARKAPVRFCRLLVHLVEEYGHRTEAGWELDLALTQAELASLAGVVRRTVEKLLGRLRQEDIVRSSYRHLIVIDMDRLRAVAEMTSEIPNQTGVF
ncbi:Crp/Fnr family transcriptional regulator [Catellatospora vulcania]|uniref:Crp/Fnr family transcriptional regulator n=1 Tax=Catellatospora vulcania TaxID=1460450 RepID=UPI0012D3B980|nr:Crp/Fnr family transcriptional regulator [Catellatospora vulcania]